MRAVVVAVVMLLAGDALAKRVIMDPPLVRKCPAARTWELVAQCLAKQGAVKVLRQQRDARLVELKLKDLANYSGILLYVVRDGQWRVGGHWQYYNAEVKLLGFEQVTINRRKGWRIDVGHLAKMHVLVDDISPVPALRRTQQSLYCAGLHYSCASVQTTCEVLVHGNARFVFRGSVAIEGNVATIRGDRTRAGPQCATSERVSLGWPEP